MPQERFGEHMKSARNGCEYKFHRAIRKYGAENFTLSVIEECEKDKLDEREIYWINYYNSYYSGYNSTKGGSGLTKPLPSFEVMSCLYIEKDLTIEQIADILGVYKESVRKVLKNGGIKIKKKPLYNYKDVAREYEKTLDQHAVMDKFGCSNEVVKQACKKLGVKILSAEEAARNKHQKTVYQFNPETLELIKSYPSLSKAGEALGDKRKATNISAVCRGKQKTAYGFLWSFSPTLSKEKAIECLTNDKCRRVKRIDPKNGDEKIYNSVASAAEELSGERENNYSHNIAAAARGEIKKSYGYKWRYIER
jgi:group I intron endonuclease